MAKTIKRKGTSRNEESVELFRKEIAVKGVGTVPVVVRRPDTFKNREAYVDSLKFWRQIPDAPSAQDSVVQFYMSKGVGLQHAMNSAMLFYEKELNDLQKNMTLVAFCDDIFEVNGSDVHLIKGLTQLHIDEDYWDDTEENETRERAWMPPLPRRNPTVPTEKKLALMDMITRKSPEFAQALGEALISFYENMRGYQEVSVETDELGFHDGGVAADSLEAAGAEG